jgi:hypothetical protein
LSEKYVFYTADSKSKDIPNTACEIRNTIPLP